MSETKCKSCGAEWNRCIYDSKCPHCSSLVDSTFPTDAIKEAEKEVRGTIEACDKNGWTDSMFLWGTSAHTIRLGHLRLILQFPSTLQRENERLREALKQYADLENWGYYDEGGCPKGIGNYESACFIGPQIARAALNQKEE